MQGCAKRRVHPSHFPGAWAPLFLAGGDLWQSAGLVQVCCGKMDRNSPLGEDLAFLVLVPAHSTSPVSVQDRHTVTHRHCWGVLSKGC